MKGDVATWLRLARAAVPAGKRREIVAVIAATEPDADGVVRIGKAAIARAAGCDDSLVDLALRSLRAAGLAPPAGKGGRGNVLAFSFSVPSETTELTTEKATEKRVEKTTEKTTEFGGFSPSPSPAAPSKRVGFADPAGQGSRPEPVAKTETSSLSVASAQADADVGARVLALAPTAPALVAAAGRSRTVAKPPTDAPHLTHLVAQRMGIADAAETVCAEYHAAACVLVAAADAKAGRRFLGVVAPQPRTIYDGLAFVNDHVRGTDDWLPADAPWPEIAAFVVSVCTHALLTWGYTDPTRPDPVRLSALLRVRNGEADLFLNQLARFRRERERWERGEEGQRRREEVRQAVQRAVQASVAADDAPSASQGHERGAQGQTRETPEQRAARRAEERAAAKAAREAVAAMTDARRAAR